MKFDAIKINVRAVMDPLPEGSRMDAYYFGFEPTGVGAVDAILSAVAIAGRGAHNTADWYDDGGSYYCVRPGLAPNTGDGQGSAATLIAATAVQSAERISALAADHAALLAEVRRSPSAVPVVDDATRQEVEALCASLLDAGSDERICNAVDRARELLSAAYLGRTDK